jgi:hypothetical protein
MNPNVLRFSAQFSSESGDALELGENNQPIMPVGQMPQL